MDLQKAESAAVAEILSRASLIESPDELQELAEGVLVLKAKKLAPVASADETRLLLTINEGVPVADTDRARSLLEKRDDGALTPTENDELVRLADEIERRTVNRLEALSELAEIRGVLLPELMRSLGVAAISRG
ncbi:MAG: STAS/SEC14 domain-containing protein [Isosphaeraceae bacterium]